MLIIQRTPVFFILKLQLIMKIDIFDFDNTYDVSDIITPCIYFLISDTEVVYVGQTCFGLERVFVHRKDKIFDKIRIKYVNVEELNERERYYIQKYSPKYNNSLPETTSIKVLRTILKNNGRNITTRKLNQFLVDNWDDDVLLFKGELFVKKEKTNQIINSLLKN